MCSDYFYGLLSERRGFINKEEMTHTEAVNDYFKHFESISGGQKGDLAHYAEISKRADEFENAFPFPRRKILEEKLKKLSVIMKFNPILKRIR